MKILITGGVGLLATRIAKYLNEEKNTVILASRKVSQIKFLKKKNLIIKKINWENNESIKKICSNIDIIVHCAGPNAKDSQSNLFENYIFSAKVFQNFLDIVVKKKVKKFFFISTVHVYSNNLKNNINELSRTTNTNPYAVNKILSEKVLSNYFLNNKLKGKILRLSNVIGAPLTFNTNCWDLIANNMCLQYFKNNKIVINSEPSIKRNYVSMSDFLNIINILIKSNKDNIGKNNIINIISSKNLTIKNVVDIISKRIEKYFKVKPLLVYKNKNIKKNYKLFFSQKEIKKFNYKFENNLNYEIDEILNFLKLNLYD